MSKKIPSQDPTLKKFGKEMDEIEPLTPKQEEVKKSLESYKEAAKHDAYLFGDYDAYSAYEEGS